MSSLTVIILIFTVKCPYIYIIMLIYNISQFHTPCENTEDVSFPVMYHTVMYTMYSANLVLVTPVRLQTTSNSVHLRRYAA